LAKWNKPLICNIFNSSVYFGFMLQCDSLTSASNVAGWVAICAAAVSLAGAMLRNRSIYARLGRVLAAVGILAIGLAAGAPSLTLQTPQSAPRSYALVIDGSASIARDEAGFQRTRDQLADRILALVAGFTSNPAETAQAASILFGQSARLLSGFGTLASAAETVSRSDLGTPATASNLAAGLARALNLIAAQGGQGAVLLLSDGWHSGDLPTPLIALAEAQGIPIHVLPFGSSTPETGLLSANLGPDQALGRPSILRINLLGEGTLRAAINGTAQLAQTIPDAGAIQSLRVNLEFAQRGLNYVDLRFTQIETNAGHARRIYALVRGPTQILVYGPAAWLAAEPTAQRQITRAEPRDEIALSDYDAIVIDGLAPDQFNTDFPTRLTAAAGAGSGVFIINGPLRGLPEAPQRIADWEATAIGPILPVNSDALDFVQDPPPRNVLIVIDTSGSMEQGAFLNIAKAVALRIIDALRPVDTLTIMPFASQTLTEFNRNSVDDRAKQAAEAFVRGLRVGGGTSTANAYRRAAALTGNYCHMFLISDAFVDIPSNSLLCTTTLVGVAGQRFPAQMTRNAAEEIISRLSQVPNLVFEAITPELRTTFWRAGPLSPQPVGASPQFTPPDTVNGIALGYARVSANVQTIPASRPPDPILAFQGDDQARGFMTAAYLGDIPASWARTSAGQAAAEAIFARLIGWDDTERYDIRLAQGGAQFTLSITVLGATDFPEALSGSLILADGTVSAIAFSPTRQLGVFSAQFAPTLTAVPQRAKLVIQEPGRAAQIIPLMLPSGGNPALSDNRAGAEMLDYGINSRLFDEITSRTGGVDLRVSQIPMRLPALRHVPDAIWPYLLVIGVILFAISLFLGGTRR